MHSVKPSVELVWPGKDPARALPSVGSDDLALIERNVAGGDQMALALEAAAGEWRNLVVHGDNLIAMTCLRERLAGAIDLIYIDPPYATGLSYYSQTGAAVERRAYRDALRGGNAAYIDALYDRLRLMRELLTEDGKLFVHCDWRANAMLRLVLDELFGADCFRNEIIWRRAPNLGRQAASKQLGRVFDSIFVYTKTAGAPFPGPVPRRRSLVPLDGKGKPRGARWDEQRKAFFTTAPRGDYTDKSIAELREQGRVYDSATGTVYIKYFLTKGEDGRWVKEQPVDALWDDFEVRPLRHRPKAEAMGYDTQKPEGLLERILGWATQPGDLVADFYGGSGTTATVAAAMGRRFITCDAERTAVEIGRRRLSRGGHAFDLCSVRRAERRIWSASLYNAGTPRTPGDDDAAVVLGSLGARATKGRWGDLDGQPIYVTPSDVATSDADVLAICAQANGAPVTVVAWEWSEDSRQGLRARALADHGVALTMRAVELVRDGSDKPRFTERPEIEIEIVPDERGRCALRLVGLRCPDVGSSWHDAIDAWRVDFSDSGPFAPRWQACRVGGTIALETPPHGRPGRSARVRLFTVFGDEVAATVAC